MRNDQAENLKRVDRIAKLSIGAAMALAGLALLGWLVDEPRLAGGFSGLATMKTNTAIVVVLLGIGVWRSRPGQDALPGRLCAGIVLLLALASLVESLSGWEIGIDQLLVSDRWTSSAEARPGLMSPATALLGLLMSGALLIKSGRSRPGVLADMLGLMTLFLALLACGSYLYGVEGMYRFAPYASLSISTALAFCFLAHGLLLGPPRLIALEAVLFDREGNGLGARLLIAAFLVPFATGGLAALGVRYGIFGESFALAGLAATSFLIMAVWIAYCLVGRDRLLDARQQLQKELACRDEQLAQANRLEAIGRVAGGVAHDFNNILTVIQGSTEIIGILPETTDEIRQLCQQIVQASKQATDLTAGLLDFCSGRASGDDVLAPEEIIGSMTSLLGQLMPASIDLVVDLDLGDWRIQGDASRLKQVILNLVINARDAIDGKGRIVLTCAEVDLDRDPGLSAISVPIDPGPYVTISVTDDGCGIAEDLQPRIFEPFFSTKTRTKGTGLGLATVYGIVRQAGGTIHLISAVGRGSTFVVYWPARVGLAEVRGPSNSRPLA